MREVRQHFVRYESYRHKLKCISLFISAEKSSPTRRQPEIPKVDKKRMQIIVGHFSDIKCA